MKHVAAVRKRLGTPTIFNILGPLANPAAAPLQLLGVGRSAMQPLLAEALATLGCRRGLVVHGRDGLDEVTLSGPTEVIEVSAGKLRQFCWTPGDFGLPAGDLAALQVAGPARKRRDHPRRALPAAPAGRGTSSWPTLPRPSFWPENTLPPVLRRLAAEAIDSGAAAGALGPAGRADPDGLDALKCPGLWPSQRRQAVVN